MNHLAHFKFAGPDSQMIIGSFLADFVKGRLRGQYGTDIELGMRLHRAIDAFTDTHPIVRQSRSRLDPEFRRYGGIITDIVFDHFLAVDWHLYDSRSLVDFCRSSLQHILDSDRPLPDQATARARAMHAHGSMVQYVDTAYIQASFDYLSKRLKRDNPLPRAAHQFDVHGASLKEDFQAFYPELKSFSSDFLTRHGRDGPTPQSQGRERQAG